MELSFVSTTWFNAGEGGDKEASAKAPLLRLQEGGIGAAINQVRGIKRFLGPRSRFLSLVSSYLLLSFLANFPINQTPKGMIRVPMIHCQYVEKNVRILSVTGTFIEAT